MQVDCILSYHLTEPFVFEAVESALTQTHQDLILHIVDDTGQEGFNKTIREKFPDSRIRFYKNLKNIGYYLSTNAVFPNFKGELFFVFDSDDISPNWRLADAIEIYKKEPFDIYTGGIRWITENGEITDRYGIPKPVVVGARGNQVGGIFYNPSCAVRCYYFRDIGGYSNHPFGGDKDFVIKSHFYKAKFYYDAMRVMAYRREHPKQVTKTDETGMESPHRMLVHQQIRRQTTKYYLGGVKRRIRKTGMLKLTSTLEPIPI
jgi:glycosyltransferase involved in cell wall biosynthesis